MVRIFTEIRNIFLTSVCGATLLQIRRRLPKTMQKASCENQKFSSEDMEGFFTRALALYICTKEWYDLLYGSSGTAFRSSGKVFESWDQF